LRRAVAIERYELEFVFALVEIADHGVVPPRAAGADDVHRLRADVLAVADDSQLLRRTLGRQAVGVGHLGADAHGRLRLDRHLVGIQRQAALLHRVRFLGGVADELKPETVLVRARRSCSASARFRRSHEKTRPIPSRLSVSTGADVSRSTRSALVFGLRSVTGRLSIKRRRCAHRACAVDGSSASFSASIVSTPFAGMM